MSKEKETVYVHIGALNNELANHLIGKLATLADASIKNERQVKAFKDVMKSIIWEVEATRSTNTGRRLRICKAEGYPMFTPFIEKRIEAEIAAIM